MANNSAVSTGTLGFANGVNITPVIRALFSAFALDPNVPADDPNMAYIARDQNEEVTWGRIRDDIRYDCSVRGIALPADADPHDLTEYLFALAEHIGFNDPEFKLQNLIDNADFNAEGDADLQVLFELATLLDDGHGLREIRMEGAYYSNRMNLDEFGGMAEFITKDVYAHGSSSTITTHAERLNAALEPWAPGARDEAARAAAEQIAKVVAEQLNCITDPEKRAAVASHLPKVVSQAVRGYGPPAVDPELNVTEFVVNVSQADGRGQYNPFDENFATQDLAEQAAKEYLRDPDCEEEYAEVFMQVIENNTIVETTDVSSYDRTNLLHSTEFGPDLAEATAPR